MKKTKKKAMMFSLLSGALGLLGFAACSNDADEDIRIEYGTPYTKFQVKGKVTSETDEPLKGIQVIVRTEWDNDPIAADTLYTDEKGEFQTQELETVSIDKQKICFHDIDGEENGGTFKSDSIALKDMDMKKIEEGKGWYDGKYEITPKNPIKLSKKDD